MIAGSAVLGAMVIVLDHAFKWGGVKIPFPLFPRLRFDLDGIPVVVALLLYGAHSGLMTSAVVFLSISYRDPFSAFMRSLAEFATVLGMVPFYTASNRYVKAASMAAGILSRVAVMTVGNYYLLPIFTPTSVEAVVAMLPFIAAFNVVAGALSVFGGYLIYQALIRRVPSLARRSDKQGVSAKPEALRVPLGE
ncbi:MAG: hypothetical protein QW057_06535 [Candidatus Bathyarchaeia archaeon]